MVLVAMPTSAQQSGVMGTWLTESGVAQVKIEPVPQCPERAFVRLHRRADQSQGAGRQGRGADVATDYRNENASLRSRKVIGMPLIWGFKKTSDPNTFEEGQIYNGEDGKTYTANISLQRTASCACAAMSARHSSARRSSGPRRPVVKGSKRTWTWASRAARRSSARRARAWARAAPWRWPAKAWSW
jgi:uncharacterized protein (DUF2147 family)